MELDINNAFMCLLAVTGEFLVRKLLFRVGPRSVSSNRDHQITNENPAASMESEVTPSRMGRHRVRTLT